MKKITILIIVLFLIASILTAQENTMVRIPGGTFTMGSPANEAGRWDNEIQRQVIVVHFK